MKDDHPYQHDDQGGKQNNTIQAELVVCVCKNDLGEPLMRNAGEACRAEGKNVNSGDAVRLQDQLSH